MTQLGKFQDGIIHLEITQVEITAVTKTHRVEPTRPTSGLRWSPINRNGTPTTLPLYTLTHIVGFGTTTTGIGTYRFKSSDQFDGQERSVIYDSRYYSTVSASSTTVQTLDRTLFNASKSLVQVSIGSTKE